MISIVKSVDAYHADYVQRRVNHLQNNGYDVLKIHRTEKMTLGIFGTDVTEIHYKGIRRA